MIRYGRPPLRLDLLVKVPGGATRPADSQLCSQFRKSGKLVLDLKGNGANLSQSAGSYGPATRHPHRSAYYRAAPPPPAPPFREYYGLATKRIATKDSFFLMAKSRSWH